MNVTNLVGTEKISAEAKRVEGAALAIITGDAAPTETTVGKVGNIYTYSNDSGGGIFFCNKAEESKYIWRTPQPNLTAGNNITITDSTDSKTTTISATDTTYSAGDYLSLSGTKFSLDYSTLYSQMYSDIFNAIQADLSNKWFPVGSVILSIVDTNPNTIGYSGTWVKVDEGYALWTASSSAGSTLSASLPKIDGQIWGWTEDGCEFGSVNPRLNIVSGHSGGGNIESYYWDTSRNIVQSTNSIYGYNANAGLTDTVQPPAYKIYAWRRTN